ncbi:uncharacterized protein LOC111029702 [Myzus persicae]|uniref:uncharacterized protein LOC111029702 n=1 Tax=Myzus persicae TaxID=13164 RepID=UPI000B937A24|nr:uncharacterized protein LOC111029702 [Myzus persicae]
MIKVFVLISFFSFSQSKNSFMPNLPVGEYRMIFDKTYACDPRKNNTIQFNIYFSKKTPSITELKGNVSSLIDFDDTLIVDVNAASWGTTGGWKQNSMLYISKKACSHFKNMFGNSWFPFIEGFNFPTDSCPLPAGTYSTTGIDLKLFEDHNLPKVYFYGKYKCVIKLKNVENKVLGCHVMEITLVRPWE